MHTIHCNMNENFSRIEAEITQIKKENLKQKNDLEQLVIDTNRQIDAIINEVILIVDAFEKAETKIKDMGIADDGNVQKAVKRMLQPKKVAISMLSKYNVNQIELDGKLVDDNLCTVVDTEPDPEKEDGMVLSIEKNGYVRGDRLIRRAEVIVVRNS